MNRKELKKQIDELKLEKILLELELVIANAPVKRVVLPSAEDVIREFGDDILNYFTGETLLSYVSKSDLRDHLHDNYDVDDFVDFDWRW